MRNICTIDGCDVIVEGRGLCHKHYSRYMRTGSTDDPVRITVCTISGCKGSVYARTWCRLHYRRWQDWGSPLGEPNNRPSWTGEKATYYAAHKRVATVRGKALNHICLCGESATTWAYDHADINEKRSPEGWPYSLNVYRYLPMCDLCHQRFDRVFRSAARKAQLQQQTA